MSIPGIAQLLGVEVLAELSKRVAHVSPYLIYVPKRLLLFRSSLLAERDVKLLLIFCRNDVGKCMKVFEFSDKEGLCT